MDNWKFTCKGGMVRVFGMLQEAGSINTQYVYKFGYAELSKVEESIRYSSNLQNIIELEKDMLWLYIGDDIDSIESRKKDSFKEEDTTVDFSTGGQFSINPVTGEVR